MEDDIENALKKIVIFDPKNLNQMFVFDKFNFDIKIQIIPKPQKDQIIKDKNFQEEDILIWVIFKDGKWKNIVEKGTLKFFTFSDQENLYK